MPVFAPTTGVAICRSPGQHIIISVVARMNDAARLVLSTKRKKRFPRARLVTAVNVVSMIAGLAIVSDIRGRDPQSAVGRWLEAQSKEDATQGVFTFRLDSFVGMSSLRGSADRSHVPLEMSESFPGEPKEVSPEKPTAAGSWAGAVEDQEAHAGWSVEGSRYHLRLVELKLHESDDRFFGFGSYVRRANDRGVQFDVTDYVAAKGVKDGDRVKIELKNTETDKVDLVYYGTLRSGRMFGHVRDGYAQLVAGHVTLVRR